MLSVSSISFQNHSYIAIGCVCIFVKMTASTESEWCTVSSWCFMYSHCNCVFTGSSVYLRFTTHLFASKKSSVTTLILTMLNTLYLFAYNFVDLQCISIYFYPFLPPFFPPFFLSSIPFFAFFPKSNISFIIHCVTLLRTWNHFS